MQTGEERGEEKKEKERAVSILRLDGQASDGSRCNPHTQTHTHTHRHTQRRVTAAHERKGGEARTRERGATFFKIHVLPLHRLGVSAFDRPRG